MEKDIVQMLIAQVEKIDNRLSDSMVKQAELGADVKHMSNSVDQIKEDIAEIQSVQNEHSSDIKEIKEKLLDSQSFKEFALDFAKNHPVICLVLILMVVNIILVSVGLPIINIHAIWLTLSAGA